MNDLTVKNTAYLSLGSNLGNKRENIERAIKEIEKQAGHLKNTSNYYISEAWGFETSNYFLNNLIKITTRFCPLQLLDRLKKIQWDINGYDHSSVKGYQSRHIDVDIIYYNRYIYKQKLLSIPHQQMHLRKFVLYPLKEINPDIKHPIYNKNANDLLKTCPDKSKISVFK